MKIIQSVCSQLTKIISESHGLDAERKSVLTEKIAQIARNTLDPEMAQQEKKRLHLEKLEGGGNFSPEMKVLVASKILDDITKDFDESASIYGYFIEAVYKGRERRVRYNEEVSGENRSPVKSISPTFTTVNLEDLDGRDITNVFGNESYALYVKKYGKMNKAAEKCMLFYEMTIHQALMKVDHEIEEGTTKRLQAKERFYDVCAELAEVHSEHREQITREDFQYLMGRELQGGKGRAFIDINDSCVKRLKKEYDNGAWKEGETRELILLSVTGDEEIDRVSEVLAEIIHHPRFMEILNAYFGTEKPQTD